MSNYQDFNSRYSGGSTPQFGSMPVYNNRGTMSYRGRGGIASHGGGYGQQHGSNSAPNSSYQQYNGGRMGNFNSSSYSGQQNEGMQQYQKPGNNGYQNRQNHFENNRMQGKPNSFGAGDQEVNNFGRNNQFSNGGGMPRRNNYEQQGRNNNSNGGMLQNQQRYSYQNQQGNNNQPAGPRAPLMTAPTTQPPQANRSFESKSCFEGGRMPENKFSPGSTGEQVPFANNVQPQNGRVQQESVSETTPSMPSTPSEWGKQDDLSQFIQDNQVTFKGENIPKPIMSFSAIALPDFIRAAIVQENYVTPTPIQSLTWPIAMEGRNMVGIAQTGSGKTLGFVLPGILQVLRRRQQGEARKPLCSPTILVLAPTRELAQQTQEVTCKFGGREVRSLCVYGGASRKAQQNKLDSRLDMVIATPGRLNDFLMGAEIDLHDCAYLVLDEADRMLDMGFEPQVRRIIKCIGAGCQTLMFSATWPRDVKKLAEEFLGNYAQVSIGSVSMSPVANHSINQIVEICQESDKMQRLFSVINNLIYEKENKMLIFAATKKKVNQLEREMRGANYPVVAIHGSKPQGERDNALRGFSRGKFQLMVATDVASRGLDVNDIKYVINFDFPTSAEDYIHRIGRTGRCGKTGTSFTFMTSKNASHAKELVNVLREANQPVPTDLENMARYSKGGQSDFRSRGLKKGFKRERGFNFDKPVGWQEKKFKWERKPRF